jgi:hypothetical protein
MTDAALEPIGRPAYPACNGFAAKPFLTGKITGLGNNDGWKVVVET